jgi:hypothetical protein
LNVDEEARVNVPGLVLRILTAAPDELPKFCVDEVALKVPVLVNVVPLDIVNGEDSKVILPELLIDENALALHNTAAFVALILPVFAMVLVFGEIVNNVVVLPLIPVIVILPGEVF